MYPPVQTLWLGADLSALQVLSIRSFLANGHPYHLYAYEPIENVPAGVEVHDAASVVPKERVFVYQRGFGRGSVAVFSDLFRYQLLFQMGGWWVDTDVVCLRPLVFEDPFVFATERNQQNEVTAATCVMRAPSRSELFRWCLLEAERRDPTSLEWGDIGPRLLQSAIDRFGQKSSAVGPSVFNPVDYWAFDELLAPGFDLSRLEESAAVHLWNQKWVSCQRDPDYGGAAGSLYRTLRAKYFDPALLPDETSEIESHVRFLESRLDRVIGEREDGYYALQRAIKINEEQQTSHQATVQELEQEKTLRHRVEVDRDQLRIELQEARSRLDLSEERERSTRAELDRERRVHEEDVEHARAGLEEARAASEKANDALARAQGEVDGLRHSLSWRMTAPLRAVFDWFKH